MSETLSPTRFRIRWGWFAGCILLGLAALIIGWTVASAAAPLSYLAGVLANVGTTLLLVGIVVLLERKIVDNAVRVVRSANEQANNALRAQIKDLENRVAEEWQSVTVDNVAEKKAETVRLTDAFTKRIVDQANGEE